MSNDRIPSLPNSSLLNSCFLNSRLLNASLWETSKGHAAAASVGLLVAASGNLGLAGIIVERTTAISYSGANFDVLFDKVTDATQLVSISAGSVYTGEAATLDISAIFSDNKTQSLFSELLTPFFSTDPLSKFTGNSFTAFDVPKDVVGLRFQTISYYGAAPNYSLPASTTLTFAAVPEPSSALLLAFGMVLLVACRGRIFGVVRHMAS